MISFADGTRERLQAGGRTHNEPQRRAGGAVRGMFGVLGAGGGGGGQSNVRGLSVSRRGFDQRGQLGGLTERPRAERGKPQTPADTKKRSKVAHSGLPTQLAASCTLETTAAFTGFSLI